MAKYYRGDSYIFLFSLKDDKGEDVNFESGDIVKFGMKKNIYADEYSLFKELKADNETSEIKIEFTPEETRGLDTTSYVIELELTRNGYTNTVYQEEILIEGDVVRNVPENNSNS